MIFLEFIENLHFPITIVSICNRSPNRSCCKVCSSEDSRFSRFGKLCPSFHDWLPSACREVDSGRRRKIKGGDKRPSHQRGKERESLNLRDRFRPPHLPPSLLVAELC
uniref:Uncharacterized protein n=1 Tax=Salix viminalis TaxID=40686 RepID=A0A6N2JY97_SALVM